MTSANKVIAVLKAGGFETLRSNFEAHGFKTYQYRRRYPSAIRGHSTSDRIGPVRVWHFDNPFCAISRSLHEQLMLDFMAITLQEDGLNVNRLDYILEVQ